jgi:chromatin modification-related protein VID21
MPPAIQSTSVGAVYSIPLPDDDATEQSDFDFSAALDEDAAAQPVFDGDPWAYRPQYTLPPLKSLPPEYSRRGKPGKQPKKRDRERDRGSKDDKADGKRDDGAFMGIQRWGATIKTNPAWKYVSRSQKALSSQDWTVRVVSRFSGP